MAVVWDYGAVSEADTAPGRDGGAVLAEVTGRTHPLPVRPIQWVQPVRWTC